MAKERNIYHYPSEFITELGERIQSLSLLYTTYGTINKDGSNIVWVCHALTADSDVFSWWPGLFGESYLFNPSDYFIVCVNNPGSCYGSIGPLSENPSSGKIYGHSFPRFSVRDIARLFHALRKELNIINVHTLIGGSQGGHIAQEFILSESFQVDRLILVATSAKHSAWGIAFNETQRMCIENDPSWDTDAPDAGVAGMETARAIALLSYRHYDTYEAFQTGKNEEGLDKAATYQRYQGEKLSARFNAYSYYALTQTMDSHDVGKDRGGVEKALEQIEADTLVIGIRSDILFPPKEQVLLAKYIPHAQLQLIDSLYGHDGFLIETETLGKLINAFVNKNRTTEITITKNK